jgi:uncharacterized protein (TIGR04255 family)
VTETRKSLGRWPNAPIALVLAQVKYEQTPETAPELVAERVKQVAGSRYPTAQKIFQTTFVLGPAGNPEIQNTAQSQATEIGFDLRNPENNEAVLIHRDTFTFMTASYVDSDHFAEQWKIFMGALFAERELHVKRLGLRYIDFIIPSAGHVPEDYLHGIGKSPAALGDQSQFASNLYDYLRNDGGRLRLQYFRGVGAPGLPPDLQGTVLPPTRLAIKNAEDVSAVLDMDRSRPIDESMKADTVAASLLALREDIATSFRSIMTKLADSEWKDSSDEKR